ncbi:NAD-dependent malic enzyme [Buttiauxella gaviniae]|uniref:NAD-dependent malic enzyme n=1 Tax=Buttiauxella gaviniae TaxID=82990 RepID=UPI003C77312F
MKNVYTYHSGDSLIKNSLLNKGSAFTSEERDAFNLSGLIPPKIETLDDQVKRVHMQLNRFISNEAKHVFLRNLQDTNEVLFYKYITTHIKDSLPLIYTPTVGYACQHFSEIYRRARGLFISWSEHENIDTLLQNVSNDDVKVIVVTDGERILGLGDQGIGGMGIPIGKLSLYTACGGISPQQTLPITLDVGTNNPELLSDPLYMGSHHARISDEDYYAFIDKFITAVLNRWPNVLLQFEDFALRHATPLLEKYRNRLCCFNDDIQGTAAVTLGSLLAASKAGEMTLSDQRFMFVGAGTAGCGIAELIVAKMMQEGITEKEARSKIFMVDKDGLLTDEHEGLTDFQLKLAKHRTLLKFEPKNMSLDELVTQIRPTALIGVSGCRGIFTEKVIRNMYANCKRPIVFPLSNPTGCVEAIPQDIIDWTEGNAIVASGSPFDPVQYNGKRIPIAQCNNSYIFPGIGLGVLISNATRVTENMFLVASETLAESSPMQTGRDQGLLPALNDISLLSKRIALAVAHAAMRDNVAPNINDIELINNLEKVFWEPRYPIYKRTSI